MHGFETRFETDEALAEALEAGEAEGYAEEQGEGRFGRRGLFGPAPFQRGRVRGLPRAAQPPFASRLQPGFASRFQPGFASRFQPGFASRFQPGFGSGSQPGFGSQFPMPFPPFRRRFPPFGPRTWPPFGYLPLVQPPPDIDIDLDDGAPADPAGDATAAPAPAPPDPTTPELELESGGPADVLWIQRALNRVSGAGLAEDGISGARTRAAVTRFQRKSGLAATGDVDAATAAALVHAGAEPPPGTTGATGPCRLDSTVSEVTIYQPIALGVAGVKNETAIYLPPGLRRAATVDLIVYLHGFERNRDGNIICGRARDVAEYLKDPEFALREPVRDSGKNAILVVPKLGPQSQPGVLGQPGGLTRLIEGVVQALAGCGAWSSPPGLGRLVLSAHSGGGAILSGITSRGELTDHLVEIWMFDALYGQVEAWKRFLGARPDVVARFAYTSGTSGNHEQLAKGARGANVDIARTRASGHCQVPRAELPGYLAKSRLVGRAEG